MITPNKLSSGGKHSFEAQDIMTSFFKLLFLSTVLLSASLHADTISKEKQGCELCLFAEDVFNSLTNTSGERGIKFYEESRDPMIQNLAGKFVSAFQEGASSDEKGAAVSELGRLIKCAADADYQLPYTLHRKELREKTVIMEKVLKNSLPKDPNYHKLMIESLADERWDVALYSYCKIAENRCAK